ncbi:F-box protein [Aspergillus affinis]|uniref:F-box protein n=1 Tax=Aspergillus affinis TaxID=1070780 RepID=UPI0022FDE0F4|nr:uncharacterized protein KD926_009552 [Aspergillus affinis]KAI9045138.1 hypothetical protein KD926_009552 [Aspergillus affinis]
MAFDCYCAICGVGFSGMHIEAQSETAMERRRRWVAKRTRALQQGKDFNQISREEGNDEPPIRSYDPRIVGTEKIEWLYKAHCLAMNEDSKGKGKAFISGPGYYADMTHLDPFAEMFTHGAAYPLDSPIHEDASGPVLPFHQCCLEILTRTLTGSANTQDLNLDVLYHIMNTLSNGSSSALMLSYGDDYCATHPTNIPNLDVFIESSMTTHAGLKLPSEEVTAGDRNPANPFGRLPFEIVERICLYLPGESLKALTQASLSIQLLTQDNFFWKRFMHWDMPWFWELQTSQTRKKAPEDLNYKRLYLWLDSMTMPRYGMDDLSVIGVANRRRIWGVCEQLAPQYHKGLNQTPGEFSRWGAVC